MINNKLLLLFLFFDISKIFLKSTTKKWTPFKFSQLRQLPSLPTEKSTSAGGVIVPVTFVYKPTSVQYFLDFYKSIHLLISSLQVLVHTYMYI